MFFKKKTNKQSSKSSLFLIWVSFPGSLDLLEQILHLQVQVGLSFPRLLAEHLKRLHLFLLVLLNGFLSLLLVLQELLGLNTHTHINKRS